MNARDYLQYAKIGADCLLIAAGAYTNMPPATTGEYILGTAIVGVGLCFFYLDVMEL